MTNKYTLAYILNIQNSVFMTNSLVPNFGQENSRLQVHYAAKEFADAIWQPIAMSLRSRIYYRFTHETNESWKVLEFDSENIIVADLKILIARATGLEKEFARKFDLKLSLLSTDDLSHEEHVSDGQFVFPHSRLVVQRVSWHERPSIKHEAKTQLPTEAWQDSKDKKGKRPFPPEFLCPLCSGILVHPVVVRCTSKCGRSVCRKCVEDRFKEKRQCPFCEGQVQNVIANKALSTLIAQLDLDEFINVVPPASIKQEAEFFPPSPSDTLPIEIAPEQIKKEELDPPHEISTSTLLSNPLLKNLAAALSTKRVQDSQTSPRLSSTCVSGSATPTSTFSPELPPIEQISTQAATNHKRKPPTEPLRPVESAKRPFHSSTGHRPPPSAVQAVSKYVFDGMTNSWKQVTLSELSFEPTDKCPFTSLDQVASRFPLLSKKDFTILREFQRQLKLALQASSEPPSPDFGYTVPPLVSSSLLLQRHLQRQRLMSLGPQMLHHHRGALDPSHHLYSLYDEHMHRHS